MTNWLGFHCVWDNFVQTIVVRSHVVGETGDGWLEIRFKRPAKDLWEYCVTCNMDKNRETTVEG